MPTAVCSACGVTTDADEATLLLTWTRDTDAAGRMSWVCADCTRANVRAIEAKLDREWW